MSALSIQVPFPVFQDRDGQPLDNGYVWLGTSSLNPQTNPVVAYYDSALTIVATQPLRTINGFISRAGSPAQVYVDAVNFSVLVQDRQGTTVFSVPEGTGISPNASGVVYDPVGTGAVATTVQAKLRKTFHVTDYGIGGGVSDDKAKIQTLLNEVSTEGGGEIIFDSGNNYLTSDFIAVPSNLVIRFTGAGWLKLTQSSTVGAVMGPSGTVGTPVENVTFYNPRIDANNFGYPKASTYGENGLSGSKCKNIKVFGGTIKNCRRGASSPVGTGGKAIQFEGGVEDILVDGLTAIDCTIAMETGGSPDLGGYERFRNIQYKNINVFNCERVISVVQSYSPPDVSPAINLVQIDGIQAFNCGCEAVGGTEKDFGAILLDRPSNVSLKNIVISNEPGYGTLGALIRHPSGTNCDIEVLFKGNTDVLVLHAVGSTGFGTTGTCQDNNYRIIHKGTTGLAISYVAGAAMSENLYDMVTDVVSTGFFDVAAALGTLYCTFVSGAKSSIVQGTALFIWINSLNTYPATIFNVAGSINANGVVFSASGVNRLISSVGIEVLRLQHNFTNRIDCNANGVAMYSIPTYADNIDATTAGLAAGQLYKTSSGDLRITY